MTEAASKYAVFDLDGTLADNEHRVPLIRGDGDPDWDTYHSRCVDDGPIWGVIEIARALYASNQFQILILTGRVDTVRPQTEAWLKMYSVPFHHMIMREARDHTPDHEFKARIAKGIGFQNILLAIEDRKRVVEMWRSHNVLCLHCADGDF